MSTFIDIPIQSNSFDITFSIITIFAHSKSLVISHIKSLSFRIIQISYRIPFQMSWLCSNHEALPLQTLTLCQFACLDTKTKQIFREFIHLEDHETALKYGSWKRTKLMCHNVSEIAANLKNQRDNFIDPDFPHTNQMLSRESFEEKIEWRRVKEVVANATYANEHDRISFEKMTMSRKSFQIALQLLGKIEPLVFKELLIKRLNDEGVYEFKLFHHGFIEKVVIDDFIPTYKNEPIFVGPLRLNEVYPMLLEKAIAKVCGGYDQIPESVDLILEMLSCGPVSSIKIDHFQSPESLAEVLHQKISNSRSVVLISKATSKIKNYGINQNEVYQLIAKHEIKLETKKLTLFEMVSESKLSPWNGKFSVSQTSWDQVELPQRNAIFHQLHRNRSFCMQPSDIQRMFESILLFEGSEVANKEWIVHSSENNHPSFSTFELQNEEQVLIRCSTAKSIRQCLILARVKGVDFECVSTCFESESNVISIENNLGPGKYVICVFHEWFLQKSNHYFLYMSSKSHIEITKLETLPYNFLEKVLLSLALKTQKHVNQDIFYSIQMLVKQTGFALLRLKPTKDKLRLEFDAWKLDEEDWELMEPYSKLAFVETRESELVIILRAKSMEVSRNLKFPCDAFKIKQ